MVARAGSVFMTPHIGVVSATTSAAILPTIATAIVPAITSRTIVTAALIRMSQV